MDGSYRRRSRDHRPDYGVDATGTGSPCSRRRRSEWSRDHVGSRRRGVVPVPGGSAGRVAIWAARTRTWLEQLAHSSPDAGIDVLTGYEITTESGSHRPTMVGRRTDDGRRHARHRGCGCRAGPCPRRRHARRVALHRPARAALAVLAVARDGARAGDRAARGDQPRRRARRRRDQLHGSRIARARERRSRVPTARSDRRSPSAARPTSRRR